MSSFQRKLVQRVIDRSKSTRWAQEAFSAVSMDVVLQRIVENGANAFRCPIGAVLLLEDRVLRVASTVGVSEKQIKHTTFPISQSISGKIIRRGQPLLITNVAEYFSNVSSNLEPYYSGSMLSTPLIFNKEIIGLVNFCRPGHKPFNREDLQHLITYANQAAFAVASQRIVEQRTRELKEREIELQRSEERYRMLADNVVDLIWTCDTKGRITYISPSVTSLLGYTPEECMDIRVSEFVVPEYREEAIAIWMELIREPIEKEKPQPLSKMTKYETIRKDGERLWTESTLSQFHDYEGNVKGVLGVTRDITERVKTEQKLNELNMKLVAASRQAGMAEVATGIIHNVGNVLNSINVAITLIIERSSRLRVASLVKAAKLLEEQGDDVGEFLTNDERGKHLPAFFVSIANHLAAEQKFIVKESESCGMHVEHVKNIVSTQQMYAKHRGVKEIASLDEVLNSALAINDSSLKKYGISVVREFEELPPISMDRHKILQILINLISNARHALKDKQGGPKDLIVRSSLKGDESLFIEVTDTGVGIPEENIEHIFEHGFTTKSTGNGFGLHSSANAAREMGGMLSCKSSGPGEGASFVLELPFTPE